MSNNRILILFLFFLSCNSNKEKNKETPPSENKIIVNPKADKIIMTVHEADSIFFIENAGREYKRLRPDTIMPLPPIIIGKNLNDSIILKKVKLDKKSTQELAMILASPINEDSSLSAMCEFDSHYTIALFKERNISYIRICFACRQIEESKELDFVLEFDNPKWRKLGALFSATGAIKNK